MVPLLVPRMNSFSRFSVFLAVGGALLLSVAPPASGQIAELTARGDSPVYDVVVQNGLAYLSQGPHHLQRLEPLRDLLNGTATTHNGADLDAERISIKFKAVHGPNALSAKSPASG